MAAALSIDEALARVLADAKPLPAQTVPLVDADGRVLAAALDARRTQPPDDVSAMDGYAVRGADVANAPATLTVIGEVAAGRPFDRAITSGETARIFTGGVLPEGSDTVVIQEHTTRNGGAVLVDKPTGLGKNVRKRGLDFTAGDALFPVGHRLSPADLSLAAAMNHPAVPVHRRPKIAILATGDELVMPGTTPGPGQIVYSNGFALMALARREGADVHDLGIVADRLDDTVAAVRRARDLDVDILVTTGGASVGDYDFVQEAFKAEGMALSFWKVALRPGRPLMHGRLGAMQVLGLPGNPVSTYVCAVLFLVPLLRTLAGRSDVVPTLDTAELGRDLAQNDERADYLRATLTKTPDGRLIATPSAVQDSSMLVPLARAGCLVVRAPFALAAKAGSRCDIIRLSE